MTLRQCHTCLLFFLPFFLRSQSLPIAIDGLFDDWQNPTLFVDANGDGNGVDFLECSLANDENYLFIRLKTSQEINLTDNNNVELFIDTDNNPSTGIPFNGIGAELTVKLGERDVVFKPGNSSGYFSLNDIGFFSLPTVSGKDFEIALPRSVKPDGVSQTFTGNNIRLAFKDTSSPDGDALPNAGLSIFYQFDNAPTPPFSPVSIEKQNPDHLRLMTYNTLWNGLDDQVRAGYFKRIVSVLRPDIVTFNECWDVTPGMAATFMNSALPLPNFQNWYAVKLDEGNITVSRFPFLESWLVRSNSRLTASLIDLPDNYATDILVVNAHLRCCSDNSTRQKEADAFVKFILDAKSPGGEITLPSQTPFVLSGDLNLVGNSQQLTTLLTGQVINTNTYGTGGPLDWDGSDLDDIIAAQTSRRMAYTWRNETSQYPPSRIDYHIYSGSAMEAAKSFTLETESMPAGTLAGYGLQELDTYIASDHLPKVTDFVLPTLTAVKDGAALEESPKIFPNPFSNELQIEMPDWTGGEVSYQLEGLNGGILASGRASLPKFPIATHHLAAGIYILRIVSGDKIIWIKAAKI